jgi:hypothetical protein
MCLYSCLILINSNFLDSFGEKTQIANFVKIRPAGVVMFNAGGGTDMTKLIVAFGNFENAPNTNHQSA